ncbi:heparan sulfate glucosamine 3-O-sulfotransferase 1-like [Ptychodera flava]|uniref:heparan sulfate glucosamine 3-O-sulfotransferase 1-like n=1 Tax=Ptychodera flava TaxID=63121 RepID=UPI003969DE10
MLDSNRFTLSKCRKILLVLLPCVVFASFVYLNSGETKPRQNPSWRVSHAGLTLFTKSPSAVTWRDGDGEVTDEWWLQESERDSHSVNPVLPPIDVSGNTNVTMKEFHVSASLETRIEAETRQEKPAVKNESTAASKTRTANWKIMRCHGRGHNEFVNSCARRLPQALGIGVKKCGTGAFLFFLGSHPSIAPRIGEVHFFDKSTNYEKGLEWYRKLMPFSTKNQFTVEKSPKYFVAPEVPQRVLDDLSSKTKLILVTCDPVSRSISDYVHESLIKSYQRRRNITRKASAYDIRTTFSDSVIKPDGSVNAENALISTSIYVNHVQRWLQYYPRKQIYFLDAELMKRDPYQVMRELEEFLDLPSYFTRQHFFRNKKTGYFCLAKPRERCLPKNKNRRHPSVDEKTLDTLRNFYAPFNREFAKLVNKHFLWMDK